MGQTLTHGVYLPDEGERNCYSGLAANWLLLDNSVGTIAEHTSALAGKAPLVHTHSKSDITDFPAYGTTAGTICEGNDSRLSDARTPVAHTHGKADVTDLLNSNFIPSANNSYNLGSSSYQWNNLYAKNYYYNGTAWGLDKANVWTVENTFTAANLFRKREFTLGDNSSQIVRMEYKDTNNSRWGILSFIQDTNNTVHCDIGVHALKTDGQTVLNRSVTLLVKPDNSSEFKPINDKAIDLGTSTNKWKTLNGINPGALSLPSSDSADYTDLSSNLSTNAEYTYTAPYDGWLCLYVIVNEFYPENAVGLYRSDTSANSHQWAKSVTAALNLYKQNKYQGSVMLPVESGKKYICYISLNANATIHSKYLFFYKNKGNV